VSHGGCQPGDSVNPSRPGSERQAAHRRRSFRRSSHPFLEVSRAIRRPINNQEFTRRASEFIPRSPLKCVIRNLRRLLPILHLKDSNCQGLLRPSTPTCLIPISLGQASTIGITIVIPRHLSGMRTGLGVDRPQLGPFRFGDGSAQMELRKSRRVVFVRVRRSHDGY
jgi:hypothetical protein